MDITPEEFAEALRTFRASAFRLETQPRYVEPVERELLDRYLAGQYMAPDEVPELAAYFAQVTAQSAAGQKRTRVRVQAEPPTTYQRFEQWADPWNIRAGETIYYMTESTAREIGLFPATEGKDWWLIDDTTLITFMYDEPGRRIGYDRTTDHKQVAQAMAWRDLAISHSVPSINRSSAAI
jgi:hypothetical protein